MSWMFRPEPKIVPREKALPGRDEPILDPQLHAVLGTPVTGPWKPGQKSLILGIGCFWGAEKLFWEMPGVESTSVGYAGGTTPNPTYYEVCGGMTNHAEVVQVVYDPAKVSLRDLVVRALEAHDPSQGFRQGNDVGTQYRSAFYVNDEAERAEVQSLVDSYAQKLRASGYGDSTTEVKLLSQTDSGQYYLAEDEHQQYLFKNPHGYCPHHSTGVKCG
ncbi:MULTISPECIES: peptide-methionine (S)-S-oxide reductase MsrA [Corynebacterium]|uniref:Peptide methionine sulfoxide reductase MsrA n=1 Tax=Corynebacterium flavescens TaxID=28028 RepID=A0A1L7CPN9_CORFL|nr:MULTISPECIES: peptide-methionine (S)-S-oxide reductase MsrA [Corynebacterium]APT87807.1 peptide methionine sulfoxide reductase [Corynebacterium flavescens]KAA8719815.1 peptide-methionine (S)-S-oxide reductase MsrA [Corynebacterium flavescens]MDN6100553.1 peptide-methionine (S)-S-oxide reductase MsrA [Corynebacterium flavescens]MDN6199944.1 peptide-methionine (S)-S-oxide reductase MsrA [Corynebacterium flavescens]MDN6227214.1 peptide-methionine (S)-S-oxide reductase MsrA [Corynebacterium fla